MLFLLRMLLMRRFIYFGKQLHPISPKFQQKEIQLSLFLLPYKLPHKFRFGRQLGIKG